MFTNKNQELFEGLLSKFPVPASGSRRNLKEALTCCDFKQNSSSSWAGTGSITKEACFGVPAPQRHGGRAVREHPLEEVYLQQGLKEVKWRMCSEDWNNNPTGSHNLAKLGKRRLGEKSGSSERSKPNLSHH